MIIKHKLIGITGKSRAGKDTLAKLLSRRTNYKIYGFSEPFMRFCDDFFNLNYIEEAKDSSISVVVEDWEKKFLEKMNNHFGDYLKNLGDTFIISKFKSEFFKHIDYFKNKGLNDSVFMHFIDKDLNFKSSPREIYQTFATEYFRDTLLMEPWVNICINKFKQNGSLIIPSTRYENQAEAVKENNGFIIKIIRPKSEIKRSNHRSDQDLPEKYIDYFIDNSGSKKELEKEVNKLLEIL